MFYRLMNGEPVEFECHEMLLKHLLADTLVKVEILGEAFDWPTVVVPIAAPVAATPAARPAPSKEPK